MEPNVSLWPLLDDRYVRSFGKFEPRAVDEKDGRLWIEGVASTGSVDRHMTRISQDSIRESAKRYTTRGLHYMHDPGAQIGRVEEIAFSDQGTAIRAWVGKDFEFPYASSPFGSPIIMNVNNLRAQMEQGLMCGLSIGFFCDEDGPDPDDKKVMRLKATDWCETSVCAIPSNRETLAAVARAMAQRGQWPQSFAKSVEHDASVQEALAAMRGNHLTEGEQGLLLVAKEIREWIRK